MDLRLRGKRAVITGGSAGIGLGCAEVLISEGVHVVIAARNRDRIDKAVGVLREAAGEEVNVYGISADLNKATDVSRLVSEAAELMGGIDIVINNAGSAVAGSLEKLDDTAFQDAWQLKLLGYIRMVRAVLPLMKQQGYGSIVNIIGGAARNPSPGFLPGGTANAALLNFTRGIASELAGYGVRINAISPGGTETERAERLIKQQASDSGKSIEQIRKERNSSIPLGRMVQPHEIGMAAAFLCSEASASTTGAELLIDGGSSKAL